MNTEKTESKITYPETKTGSQVDDYFGTKVADPYRWLENDTAAETEAWVEAENKVTEDYLSRIPFRQKIKDRLTELLDYPKYGAPQQDGEWFTFYKNDGLQNQAVLYVQQGEKGSPEVLLDPNKLSKDGTVALQATAFSKHQKYFAYAASASGSDWQEISIMDFATKKLLDEKLDYVKFTGMSWKGDEGFYYSGYDKPKDEALKFSNKTEYQKVFFHKIGTPQSADVLVYEDRQHPLRYVGGYLTEDERFLVLNIAEGTDGSEIKVKDLQDANGPWLTIVPGFTTNAGVVDNVGDKILLQTNESAPNYKVVLLDPKNPAPEHWKTIIPEQQEKLDGVSTGGGKLFASYLKDACTKVDQYSYEGTREHEIELPGLGTASGFGSHKEDHSFFYTFTSFTYPATIFKYDIASGKSTLFRKSEAKFNPEDYETKQVFYTSKDGTQVPMFITHKKGIKLDGNNPTLLYAYGGFNISITPAFSATNMVFIENGGIYCVANLRGGGEYGEAWHKAGMFGKKQNVFDDFIAAAEYLVREKYTNSKKLAIRGGSNGGLLVGACMTQRPELFAVAIPQVGVMDMLRYHKFTVGWGWVSEYGSSDHKEQFDYLIKYSPLHNLKKGTCYPATLVTTADHDDRVVPAHSFKFAATLQADQGCNNPTLIRIESKAGHGAGKPTTKIIDEAADIWSFVFYNMGVKL
jgi:prolyl oligopeptidase